MINVNEKSEWIYDLNTSDYDNKNIADYQRLECMYERDNEAGIVRMLITLLFETLSQIYVTLNEGREIRKQWRRQKQKNMLHSISKGSTDILPKGSQTNRTVKT